jgi:hypothetical protein
VTRFLTMGDKHGRTQGGGGGEEAAELDASVGGLAATQGAVVRGSEAAKLVASVGKGAAERGAPVKGDEAKFSTTSGPGAEAKILSATLVASVGVVAATPGVVVRGLEPAKPIASVRSNAAEPSAPVKGDGAKWVSVQEKAAMLASSLQKDTAQPRAAVAGAAEQPRVSVGGWGIAAAKPGDSARKEAAVQDAPVKGDGAKLAAIQEVATTLTTSATKDAVQPGESVKGVPAQSRFVGRGGKTARPSFQGVPVDTPGYIQGSRRSRRQARGRLFAGRAPKYRLMPRAKWGPRETVCNEGVEWRPSADQCGPGRGGIAVMVGGPGQVGASAQAGYPVQVCAVAVPGVPALVREVVPPAQLLQLEQQRQQEQHAWQAQLDRLVQSLGHPAAAAGSGDAAALVRMVRVVVCEELQAELAAVCEQSLDACLDKAVRRLETVAEKVEEIEKKGADKAETIGRKVAALEDVCQDRCVNFEQYQLVQKLQWQQEEQQRGQERSLWQARWDILEQHRLDLQARCVKLEQQLAQQHQREQEQREVLTQGLRDRQAVQLLQARVVEFEQQLAQQEQELWSWRERGDVLGPLRLDWQGVVSKTSQLAQQPHREQDQPSWRVASVPTLKAVDERSQHSWQVHWAGVQHGCSDLARSQAANSYDFNRYRQSMHTRVTELSEGLDGVGERQEASADDFHRYRESMHARVTELSEGLDGLGERQEASADDLYRIRGELHTRVTELSDAFDWLHAAFCGEQERVHGGRWRGSGDDG